MKMLLPELDKVISYTTPRRDNHNMEEDIGQCVLQVTNKIFDDHGVLWTEQKGNGIFVVFLL